MEENASRLHPSGHSPGIDLATSNRSRVRRVIAPDSSACRQKRVFIDLDVSGRSQERLGILPGTREGRQYRYHAAPCCTRPTNESPVNARIEAGHRNERSARAPRVAIPRRCAFGADFPLPCRPPCGTVCECTLRFSFHEQDRV